MADYEGFKNKAKNVFVSMADMSMEMCRMTEEKARVFARRARLNAEITRENAQIRRDKSEIGKKYYMLHKDDPEDTFKVHCESITESIARIRAKKKELEDLKKYGMGCDCGCDCDEESCETEPALEAEPKTKKKS